MITKADMLYAINSLPEDATIEDAIEALRVIEAIDRGIAAAEAGDIISHEDLKQEVAERFASSGQARHAAT